MSKCVWLSDVNTNAINHIIDVSQVAAANINQTKTAVTLIFRGNNTPVVLGFEAANLAKEFMDLVVKTMRDM